MGGILAILIAMFVFTSTNAFLKTAEHSYAPTQVVFFRNIFALIPYFITALFQGEIKTLSINHYGVHFFRGAIGVLSLSCLFQSLIMMPLADAMTLSYMTSIFMVLLSAPLLKERIHPLGWLAVSMGFLGVLLIAQPRGDIFNMGVVLGLISAFCEAFIMVQGRLITHKYSNSAIVIYYALFAALITGLTLPFVWKTPTFYDFIVLATLGIGGGIGQFLITVAYRKASIEILSPMIYTSLIWSFFYGVILFGEIPSKMLYAGVGLIIAAGIVVIFQGRFSQEQVSKIE